MKRLPFYLSFDSIFWKIDSYTNKKIFSIIVVVVVDVGERKIQLN